MLPNSDQDKWWETTPLEQMTSDQWEAVCDGCGKCCMVRIWHNNDVKSTKVGCELLDIKTAKCSDYQTRHNKVKNCVKVTIEMIDAHGLLPDSCSYKRLRKGKPLYDWHHLISGDQNSVITQGHSIVGYAVVTTNEISPVKMQDYLLKAVDYFDQK
jgi:uncharacterized cysteine cluster protein YcgN (CxxCxxCC family)